MDLLPMRLAPGADLRRALEAAGAGGAFVVSAMGSLRDVQLRFAGAAQPTLLPGDFEIVSMAGAITAEGAHLHMAEADAAGAVFGGHVVYGNLVRTTAEVLLAPTPGWHLARQFDPATGYAELVVRAADPGA
ncbi:PPC domain-containing DNA-binding protein [Massilia sp. DWR3-1-1]|uniref:PPC domain-containing DNA-binding protein n=1 Tax=Massilia sp. DWR3-1-1 TaxID=2804559 RepID=UPI003CF40FFD